MTRRDFDLIASAVSSALAGTEGGEEAGGVHAVAWHLSTALHDSNPRFDQVRFLEACGVLEPSAPKAKGRRA